MKVKSRIALPTALVMGKTTRNEPFVALILKGTFLLAADRQPARFAVAQVPVLGGDVPYDPAKPGALLRFESELVPFKPRCDVVLVGSAYAPKGRPVRSLDVKIRVGTLDRTLRVTGDRFWAFDSVGAVEPVMSEPAIFTQMPLTYDRAFGGVDDAALADPKRSGTLPWYPNNWFGRGYVADLTAASIDRRPLPNIEDPAVPVRAWDSRAASIGCGYYPRNSKPRLDFAGTYDEQWRARRAPDPPLDFRFDVFNGADPAFQIDTYLAGNEPVSLHNVHRECPVLAFSLPCLKPVLTVRSRARTGDEADGMSVEPVLDTVIFVPDEGYFCVLWRAVVAVQDEAASDLREIDVEYRPMAPPASDERFWNEIERVP